LAKVDHSRLKPGFSREIAKLVIFQWRIFVGRLYRWTILANYVDRPTSRSHSDVIASHSFVPSYGRFTLWR